MYCIYKVTNKENGKIYIGKTNDFERRKREHLKRKSDHLFSRAIQKYGESSFLWEIMESGIETRKEASKRERYWIERFRSYYRWEDSNGYNMTFGGDGDSCWNVRMVASYSLDGKLLKTFDSVTEAMLYYKINGTTSISVVCDDKTRSCHGMMFRYFNARTTPPIKIEKYSKRKSTRAKKVVKMDLSGNVLKTYDSIGSVEKDGICRTTVMGCLRGEYRTAGGFLWCYEEDLKEKIGVEVRPIIGRRVKQFTLDWGFIREFENCAEAAIKNGFSYGCYKNIHKALQSKSHISHGFRWIGA